MRKIFLVIILIFIVTNVSADIIVNEFEINGAEGDEWVELYNDGENDIDISGWEIWEGIYGQQGPKLILSIPEGITIQKESFYIVEWGGTKLNNNGDFVILYDSTETKIDETETLDDSLKNDKTHQLCNGKWKFLKSTKNSENDCPKETTTTSEDETSKNEATDNDESSSDKSSSSKKEIIDKPAIEKTPSVIRLETINLNPQVIKTENDNGETGKNYAVYGFVAFCVLLGVLFTVRKNKYKNEFR